MKNKLIPCLIAATLGLVTSVTAQVSLIAPGATWKYLDTGVDQGVAWKNVGFNDTGWKTGVSEFGYGDLDEATTLEPGPAENKFPTHYFRHTFQVPNNPATYSAITLTLTYDDGAVVYLNGAEVHRVGMPAGAIAYATYANANSDYNPDIVAIPASALVAGENTIAVEVHQANATSSDLSFNLSLTAALDSEVPVLITAEPPAGATVDALPYIGVLFNESVANVSASDLLINNIPATGVTQVSPREYQFTFSTPPTGAVQVAFAGGHGITDLAPTPNAFGGGNWTYTFDPNAAVARVVISEFVADNQSGIEDNDGTRGDWLEIYNPGPGDVNLGGWALTDTPTNQMKWRFPPMNLAANRYLLIYASEKNRTNAAAPLHTNFRIGRNAGGYLALSDSFGIIVSQFANYPAQSTDVSYGRDRVDPNLVGYFTVPTPGAANSTSGTGFSAEPVLNYESGVYTNNSLSLTISAPVGATIRYTIDGTEPTNTASGLAYTGPISISGNTIVKARVFQAGLWPSAVKSRNFIMLDSTMRDFTSNLPFIVIATPGSIPASVAPGGSRRRGSLAVFDTFRGRSSIHRPDFIELAQFETFGQTSEGFAKKPHNIEINDEYGADKARSVLGMPSEADWKMRNPWSDKCLMNDFLAYELFEQMGNYSCRRRFVEVFINPTAGSKLSYGNYYGVLVFLEKIEIDNNRVNVAELTPAHTNEPAITGGYIFKKDKNSTGDLDFSTTGGGGFSGIPLKFHDPKPRELNNSINHPQAQWLRNYLNQFETNLYAADWLTRTGTNHYSHYIDVDSFIDGHWIVEFPKQIDGYRISNYYSKDRGGKVKNSPIWDWNLSFGNADYLQGGTTNGWYYTQTSQTDHMWGRRLMQGNSGGTSNGDPDYNQKVVDRWSVLRTNIFNGARLTNRIDEIARYLGESATRNYQKYNNLLGVYLWPNPNGGTTWHVDYVRPTNYFEGTFTIISEMKKWTYGRYLWVDSQFVRQPAASSPGGNVPPGTQLTLTAANPIYYTLDGSDPRLPGGSVSPSAALYSGPITINANARVFARARAVTAAWQGTTWSGPTVGTYVTSTPKLIVSELMYNPAPPPVGTLFDNDEYEYVEVKNTGTSDLNLQGFRFTAGLNYVFPSVVLPAGQSGVVVANPTAFESRYGAGRLVLGQYTNRLANEGERIALVGPVLEPLLDFEYKDGWYPITDGLGFSLVVANENQHPTNWGTKLGWRVSGAVHGSPSQADPAQPAFPSVVVNEALTHTDLPQVDTIEFANVGTSAANISYWYLSDDRDNPKKYRFPAGVTIPAGGVFSVSEAQFNSGPNAFAISSLGDEIYIFSGDVNGNLTGYIQGYDFGAQFTGVTFGRHVTSTGDDHFVAQSTPTLDAVNSSPLVGPIVINEINYQPVDVFVNGAVWNNTEDEYIELYNLSASTVLLYDPAAPTNTWRLRDAVDYSFPTGTSIPGGGYIIVADIDRNDAAAVADFRARNGVPANVPVYGPWEGNLDNSGESVELVRPDAPEEQDNEDVFAPYVLADKVRYSSLAPWPGGAGIGASLQRVNSSAYGNDPANWRITVTSPGGATPTGTTAQITQQPVNTTVLETRTAVLAVTAVGAPPLRYQWHYNGQPIYGAVSPSLVIENAQLNQAGQYGCYVINAGGVAASTVVTLTVLPSAKFTEQPKDTSVKVRPDPGSAPTTNASFNVQVFTQNPPVSYQWRFNGEDIPGANSAVLTVVNVTTNSYGQYSCAVTDGNGTVFSQNATLYPLITPAFSVQPISQIVPAGSMVSLSAQHGGFPGPFTNEWRLGSTGLTTNQTAFGIATYTFRAPLTAGVTNNRYNVIVKSRALPQPGVRSAEVSVSTVADTDGDGIPDSLETTLGLNPNNASDGSGDLDGDTMSNSAEVIAGTDPQNAASYLKADHTSSPGIVNILLRAVAVRTYTIQYTDDLGSGVWSKLGDVAATTTDRDVVLTDSTANPNRVYRIATPATQ